MTGQPGEAPTQWGAWSHVLAGAGHAQRLLRSQPAGWFGSHPAGFCVALEAEYVRCWCSVAPMLDTTQRPDRRLLVQSGVAVAAALVLDAVVVLWALATLLSPSCGEDLAWLGTTLAAGVASIAALGDVLGVIWSWRRGRPLANYVWWHRGLLVVVAAALIAAIFTASQLPTGSCA